MSIANRANEAGLAFEQAVAGILRSQGLNYQREHVTGCIGDYGEDIRVDFYLPAVQLCGYEEGLYIECRWQQSSGSVDRKNSSLKDNVLKHYDRPTIVVCGGAKIEASYRVLRNYVGRKLLGVYRLEEFVAFAPSMTNGACSVSLHKEYLADQQRLFDIY